jgi:hypothetical protein
MNPSLVSTTAPQARTAGACGNCVAVDVADQQLPAETPRRLPGRKLPAIPPVKTLLALLCGYLQPNAG